jgi:hypothetical protein
MIVASRLEYFSQLNANLEQLNYDRALADKHEARLFIAVYRSRRSELVKRHGIGAVIGDGPHLVYQYLNDLLLEVIEEVTALEWSRDWISESVLKDDLELIEHLSQHIDALGQPTIVTLGELKEETRHRIDRIIGDIYSLHVDKRSLGRVRRRQKLPVDWGKVILVLAAYIDINSPLGEEFNVSFRRDHPGGPRDTRMGRLVEFMPEDPMRNLLAAVEGSPVFEKIYAWNQRQTRFSR